MSVFILLLFLSRIEAIMIDSLSLRYSSDRDRDHMFTSEDSSNILKLERNVRAIYLQMFDKDNINYKPMLTDTHDNHTSVTRSGLIGERSKKPKIEHAYIRISNGSTADSLQSLENASSVVQYVDTNTFRVSDRHVGEQMLLVLDSCRDRLLEVCTDKNCRRRHVTVHLQCSYKETEQQIKTVLEANNEPVLAVLHNKTHDRYNLTIDSSATVRCTTASLFMDDILRDIDASFDKSQLTVHMDNIYSQLYTTSDQKHTFKLICIASNTSLASFRYIFHNGYVHTVELFINCTKPNTVKEDVVSFIKDERDNIIYMSLNQDYNSIVINSADIVSDVSAVLHMQQSLHQTFVLDKDTLAYITYSCIDDKSHWVNISMQVYGRPIEHRQEVHCNSRQPDRNIYVEIGAVVFCILIGISAYMVVAHINGRLHRLKAMKQRQRDKKYLEIVSLQ